MKHGTVSRHMYAAVWQQTCVHSPCDLAVVSMRQRCRECMWPGTGFGACLEGSTASHCGVPGWENLRLPLTCAPCAILQISTALTAYQVDVRLFVWYALLCWGE